LGVDRQAGIFGGQSDGDVAQFAHVAGEVVVLPHLLGASVERERLVLGLAGVEIAEVVEQGEFIFAHFAQRWHRD
jgi:hypothetical protein